MYRGEKPVITKLAPFGLSLKEVAEHAVDFWLSTEDLPRPENRVSVDREGRVTLSYRASNDGARDRLLEQLRSLLGHLGIHEHHLIPRWAYLENKIRSRASPTRPAPVASAPIPPPRHSTATAALTRWTTSTWSTRASSRASRRSIPRSRRWPAVRVGDHLLERLGGNAG
jgi:hypothetical protein